jgi:hypothetical protein
MFRRGPVLAARVEVAQRFLPRVGPSIMAAVLTTACAAANSDVEKHAEKMASLRASTVAVGESWLAGDVSGTYTRGALEQIFELVDQERAAVAANAEDLARPAADAVARDGEQLQRALASISNGVAGRDGSSVRRQLTDLSGRPSGHP